MKNVSECQYNDMGLCYGCCSAWYHREVHRLMSHAFGAWDVAHKRKLGMGVMALHIVCSMLCGFVVLLVPLTPLFVACFVVGAVSVACHWYVLGGCCVTPIENYLLGHPSDPHPYFVTAYARLLRMSPERVVLLASVTPVMGILTLTGRWWLQNKT